MSRATRSMISPGGAGETEEGPEAHAKDLARFLFRKYCGPNQYIPMSNIQYMVRDIYTHSHDHYEELDKEKACKEYHRIIDNDRDGKVTLGDVEIFVRGVMLDNDTASSPLYTKIRTIREEDHQRVLENMHKSFESFRPSNFNTAKDVFNAYDIENIGYIDQEELPLILGDVCRLLNLSPEMDRDLLMNRIEGFNFRTKGKMSQREFEYLYTQHFDL